MAELCAVRASRADLKFFTYEEALKVGLQVGNGSSYPRLRSWAPTRTSLMMDQNSPKYPDHAQRKEGQFGRGCTPMAAHQSKSHESEDNQKGQEGKFQDRERSQGLPALFRGPVGMCF
jgi:hypothetical protein